MGFDRITWKAAAAEKLQGIGDWLERRRVKEAPYLVYGTLCGLSLWPLVEAARAGQLLPVVMALGGVAGGVGGNLLAEQVQRWKDRTDRVDEDEIAGWVAEQAPAEAELRQALDAILEELEAIPQAQAALGEEQLAWFAGTLRQELTRLGNLDRFAAALAGPGALAQGPGAQAASGRAVVSGGPIQAPVSTGEESIAAGGHVVQAEAGSFVSIGDADMAGKAADQEIALRRYLNNLRRLCNALPLAALAEEEGAHRRAEITLNRVYISLDTTTQMPLTDQEKLRLERERPWQRRETRALSALEAAAGETRLVLLGDPGSGKSTFVNHLAYLLAGSRLGQDEVPEGWPHGPLLPVRFLLRELAAHLPDGPDLARLSAEKRASRLVAAVWEHLRSELAATYWAEDALPTLERGLDRCRALLIFDGLDEVALERRELVHEAVGAFARHCGENRVLVTCRVRSYHEGPPLQAFADVTLAPFREEQIDEFIERWYGALAQVGALRSQDARERAGDLRSAVRPLLELARNPLLLMTMAVVHTAQVELPRERARLYRRCVDVLLRRWHRHKAGQVPLLERLGVNEAELLAALQEVACQAHERGGTGEEGDLPQGEVLRVLAGRLGNYTRAEQFLGYVDTRAGLMVGRGGAGEPVYTFPHRTFQEYLAGCHLALGGRDFGRRLRGLLAEGDRWALAAQLGAEHLLYNVGDVTRVLDAAYSLCPVAEPRSEADWRGVLWAGQFAAEAGRRKVEEDTEEPDGGAAFLDRLVPRLLQVMRGQRLAAIERAAAGRVLSRLGDPRPEVMTVEGMEFCYVPPGPFVMGSEGDDMAWEDEQPQHPRDIPYGYWLARYPVTTAQYMAFVDGSGYGERRHWTEAGWQRKEAEGWAGPRAFGESYDLANHPVVGVSWYEALAFCRWLTEEMRARLCETMTSLEARLPTEAEWEKSARGGLQVPRESVVGLPVLRPDASVVDNPDPARRYPWGSEPEPERANYGDTRIGSTSAVGCFPGGVTPYGAEEMSGNVLEWCATPWQEDYRDYQDDYDLEDDTVRVLRGGAFFNNQRFVRCAYRYRDVPDHRYFNLGFRVVVAPVPSVL
jgi:formylglycine-generating enzyme required for sulfatase activity